MAQIKIKRTSGSSTPTGLTFGELAYVQGTRSIFIGQTAGDPALRIGAEVDSSTSLGTSNDKIPTQGAVKSYVDNNLAGGAVTSVDGVTGAVDIAAGTGIGIGVAGKVITITNTGVQSLAGTPNQITVSGATGAVTLSLPSTVTVPGALNVTTNLTVTGNLTVNGTTTTVNSDTMTIDDPVLTLGTSGGVPIAASDGGKDRGIIFNYFDTAGRTGFFGWDADGSRFIFAGRATVTSDVVQSTGLSYSPIQSSDLYLTDNISGNFVIISPKANATQTPVYTLPDYEGGIFLIPENEGTANYIIKSSGAGGRPTWVAQSTLSVGSASTLATARTIGITGDINGTATSFDGSANINISAVIAPNSVALGTDTTGNYVATLSTSSTGLSVANSGSESAAVTVNFSTITSGLNMGTFSFATGEFTNSSGTVSIGTVDGGTFT